eukprot:Colp12_sorted_trinity150504_noHs@26736
MVATNDEIVPVRGKPVSGRVWKDLSIAKPPHKMFNATFKTSWDKRQKQRAELAAVKAYEKQLKDAAKAEIEEKKKRREENEKRRLENEKKAEVVQKINSRKIKKMSKKQLRLIKTA